MKRQKQILMENTKSLENASNNILNTSNERKYEKKDDTKIKEEEKGEERKLSKQLQDITRQPHTKAEMRVNANKEIEDEVSLIKTRITRMWKSITNESMTGHDSKQQRHFESVEMLDNIEASFFNLRLQNNRYEKERGCIFNELKELTKDIEDLTKKRHVESDEAIDDGIQTEIRQIRSKLDRQKRDFSERQIKQQDEHNKWLTDLWNVVYEEGVAKKCATGGAAGSDSDISEMRNVIIQNMKRWKTDRLLVVSVTRPVLQGISRLMTNEPFNFSVPQHFDSNKVVKGIPPVLHSVVTDISRINQCLKENCKSFHQKFVRTEAYNELKENEKSLLCEIKDLKKEKDVLLNRLSKVAGANLTDNNPNIADLSDPNRATKLAEQFSELYDNPWTDAFEALESPDERRRIDFLLNIIVESYNVCRTISKNQQEALSRAMHNPSKGMTQEKDAKKPEKAKPISLSKVQSKTLAELRKQCAEISVADVKSFIATEHKEWVRRKELEKYTMICIELCWLMHLQSPPVYMDVHVEDGTTFNTSKHKQYTKTGTKLDFLVWPALMLNEGGPILCKGVAQGK